jgi:hypothetical protein
MNVWHCAAGKRRYASVACLALVVAASGCSLFTPKAASEPAPSIAETDQTLSTPMRPPSNQRYAWWEFHNILDPRSQEIEKHLGF